jgi:hypothetical protein
LIAVVPTVLIATAAAIPAAPVGTADSGVPDGATRPGPVLLDADPYTGTAAGLAPGQIEVAVTSTRSSMVTGGDARMEVRGLDRADELRVLLQRASGPLDVTGAFVRHGRIANGVVRGFVSGPNLVTASVTGPAGERHATLEVRNHPVTGPVISGPRPQPFICETTEAGLGPPIDEHCSIEPREQFFARTVRGEYVELSDPYGPYPPSTATAVTRDGAVVPFVVRVETRTINRGITRIAVLDDPASRGPGVPYRPTAGWNRSAIHQFGESCGTRFGQGVNRPETVLRGAADATVRFDTENIGGVLVDIPARLAEGYAYVHNTQTVLGVHCNPLLSAETMAMVREHLVEAYGPIEHLLGLGASGGAIQQYQIIDSYPGLLSVGVPILSFPDVVTTAMSTVDCGLLQAVFDADPGRWTDAKQTAVTGFATVQICRDWIALFLDRLDPTRSCGLLPEELRYHPEHNPGGTRCTVQDNLVNLLGRDPTTGFARLPLDNTGVLYGLEALREGRITPDDFVVLNRSVGGFDHDARRVPARMAMPADLARTLYRAGAVTGRAELAGSPVIDLNPYVDLIPVLGFHDQVRAYTVADRLAARGLGASHLNWTGLPLPADAFRVGHRWADAIAAGYRTGADRAAVVAEAAPADAVDQCVATLSPPLGLPVGVRDLVALGVPGCDVAHDALVGATPRMRAGGPSTEDVIKCRLKPLEDAELPGLSPAQREELRPVFPDGVCDWTRPGVGQEVEPLTWTSVGASQMSAPVHSPNLLARSAPPPGTGPDDPAAPPAGRTLPATGSAGHGPVALAGALLALVLALAALRVRSAATEAGPAPGGPWQRRPPRSGAAPGRAPTGPRRGRRRR